MMGYFGSKISVWLAALGLVLALVGLLVATGESIRHPATASVPHAAPGPEQPITDAPVDGTYHDPALSAWMTP